MLGNCASRLVFFRLVGTYSESGSLVPEQFVEVGKAMAEHLAMPQRTVDRLGGGKAADYAAVKAAIAEGASRTELAAHGAILKSLDIDVPAVVIGRVRYTRVGRCEGA